MSAKDRIIENIIGVSVADVKYAGIGFQNNKRVYIALGVGALILAGIITAVVIVKKNNKKE